jgi:hypothetical protein
LQKEKGVDLEEPFADARTKPEVQRGGSQRRHIESGATLATRQRLSARRPNMLRVLAADGGEDGEQQFVHVSKLLIDAVVI